MNLKETKNKIENGAYDNGFNFLYGESKNSAFRYIKAINSFNEVFGEREEIRLFSAPGRTEIGGNHTDHQHGSIVAAAVNLDVIAVVSPNNENIIRIKSEGYDMDTVDLSVLSALENEKGRSAAIIRGVAAAFKEKGYNIGGFDAYTTSNVLKGSGLSSSAAFEVLVSNILNNIYNNAIVSTTEMAKFSQYAEREFFGKPCGLLDQMASATGGFIYVDFNNPSEPEVMKLNYDLDNSEYKLCVVDTGGNHANLTSDYADITYECKQISNLLNVEFLRDADQNEFYKNLANLRSKSTDRAILRAFHFFTEQDRVLTQRDALSSGDFNAFLNAVNASGDSSYKYLQNLYSNSNTKEQPLCLAIALTQQFLNGDGACRVHGGGFAGTIQAYIKKDKFEDYQAFIEAVFGAKSCIPLKVRKVGGYELTAK
ncbi:MAG: galactokinase family protein [Oscillospiraceae bacterium]|nr:galactokinase family protein [Oscillospiraceae bacterium]